MNNELLKKFGRLANAQVEVTADTKDWWLAPFSTRMLSQKLYDLVTTELSLKRLTNDRILHAFFSEEAAELVTSIAPNPYWFWRVAKECMTREQGDKITRDTVTQALAALRRSMTGNFYVSPFVGPDGRARKAIAKLTPNEAGLLVATGLAVIYQDCLKEPVLVYNPVMIISSP